MKKNIIITGAAGNLGKACVEKFIKEGYSVIATVSPGKKLAFVAESGVDIIEVDLADENKTEFAINKLISKYKIIDAGLFLVGGFAVGGIKETDGNQLKKLYALNFETAYYAVRPIFLHMLSQAHAGRLVLVGARPALEAHSGKDLLAYSLSKSLLFKLAEYLNAEGAEKNIVTSVVVPGVIDTPQNRQAIPEANFSDWVTPEAIAEAMYFLVSSDGNQLRDPVLKVYGNA